MDDYINKLFGLNGKVAIITGGAKGIGRAFVHGFLHAGADVVIVDRSTKELEDTCKTYSPWGYTVHGLNYDLTHDGVIDKIVAFTMLTFNRIDVLINCAGITIPHQEPYPDEAWDETLDTNLVAPFKLMRAVIPHMVNQGSGSIINITSLNAKFGFPNNPAYLSSKGGLSMMTKGFAVDFSAKGVRVNNLAPGYTRATTSINSYNDPVLRKQREDRTIMGRWAEPEDMVGTAIFLASDASSYITGQDIYVDGGWSAKGL